MSPRSKIRKGDILIRDGQIDRLGGEITAAGATVLEATGMVAMPGFVQTHIHLCQTLFRNQANDLELLDWLQKRIWPLEAAHTPASIAISARLGLLELIKSGTTAIQDMGSVTMSETMLQEVERSGMRASVGVTFMDSGDKVPAGLLRPWQETLVHAEGLVRKWHGSGNDRIRINLAPRFALSCSGEAMSEIAERARKLQLTVHTHASENRKEVELIRRQHNLGNVAYYHSLGMTGDNLSLAHCIWLDDEEIDILSETGTRILHCPSSNLKLGSGIADIPAYRKRSILCSLGADGAPCNNNLSAFTEMRLTGLIQKPRYGPAILPAREIVQMATLDGARALHWDHLTGSLEEGKRADLILLSLNMPHTEPFLDSQSEEIYAQIVYAANAENVQTVIIDGEIVMRDRRVLTLDEEETLRRAREELRQLLHRAKIN